ncbi:cysteine desulfurase, SufS subfamily [Capnocytophaga ochracea DSM 7271]|jgi:cysteine desulfurase, sufS subfamily|uniref:Cysteine desulfurase n=1 Tax=Capnocytophaga ochracea (strain ATCC 27872 / DSM 7271 / CCUG 9716 / JCM 12966 / NCTC 12371 / SS31 / VPI 2845) TaxID=521097 RepID=C7M8K4_CAPOD|nr:MULTISPECIES: cysteine desulfurase [Capnocytophaga]ACU93383.1 cysteine desulfurase, SufS subfamily [Capnocytophaga ochracea DSM 7271]QLF49226.1 cysteine desulfurase [Capnocytophaga sp. oral taxon 902]UAK52071.1 cysteine desulfurase [Capnocytophaga ochracea]
MKSILEIRTDFPILSRTIHNKPLIYFDNGATSQTPTQVIEAIVHYYSYQNANIHRGVHTLSQEATDAYEEARKKLQRHFNARKSSEILFTAGTTHGINLVANGYSALMQERDEVIISASEHHSNIVPWQLACQRSGATLKVIPMNEKGILDLEVYNQLLNKRTKIVCVQHVSNALGNIHPIEEIIEKAHRVGAVVLVDGAQAAPHLQPDMQTLDVDFYAVSAHKMYGPTGIGALYGKEELLLQLPPYQGGGEMIKEVHFEESTYADLPYKFEAGTPNICGGIAFGTTIDYIQQLGMEAIATHEHKLLEYAIAKLQNIEGITLYGNDDLSKRTAVISFNLQNIHPYDVGVILDQFGIAVRTGHHCAQPIMDFYCIPGTVRASFAVYNTFEEIDTFVEAVKKAQKMLS